MLEPYAADPQDAVRAFWQRLSGVHGQSRALIGGPANPLAPVVRWDKAEDAWVGRTTLGVGYQGPPGRVHGGMVAALLDSVLGRAQPRDGLRFTRTLTIDYLAATPLFTELVIRARPDDPGGRKVWITGEVEADGVVTATARGLWVAPRTVPADAPGDLGLELGRPGPAAST
nr:PaaI family thioesterase [Naumannella cuiyingiana]